MSELEHDDWSTGAAAGFIDPVPMEDDPTELFPGDTGTLEADVRRVLVQLLRRKFLLAEKNPAQWRTLLENQQIIESRMHDLFIRLVVDHERGVAYNSRCGRANWTCRSCCGTSPQPGRDVGARAPAHRVPAGARLGETSARVDIEELEQTVLTYFDPEDHNLARTQQEVRGAVQRLATEDCSSRSRRAGIGSHRWWRSC